MARDLQWARPGASPASAARMTTSAGTKDHMANRMSSLALAASMLAFAAPTLADEHPATSSEPHAHPPCCARVARDVREHVGRAARVDEREHARVEKPNAPLPADEDGFHRRPYWEGP